MKSMKALKTTLLLVAALAGLPSPASADDEFERLVKAAEKARKTPEAQASNHGSATAAYEKVCGNDLVVTDEKLRAKFDRLYRNHPSYIHGYRWTADQYAAVNSDWPLKEGWLLIHRITGAEMAGWAKVPADRLLFLENKVKQYSPR